MGRVLAIDELTRSRQNTASDPTRSVWVGANAGSGKTYVLSRRVMRLLLQGTDPQKILCLTYTKAAATEMSERVFDALAKWAMTDDATLDEDLAILTGARPNAAERARARRLFARALETPGGLKIQTIHAFCERVLHQFPIEANVAGHFELLDDAQQTVMQKEAMDRLLRDIASAPESPVGVALNQVLAHNTDTAYRQAIETFVREARTIGAWLEQEGSLSNAESGLRTTFDLHPEDTLESVAADIAATPDFPVSYLKELLATAQTTGKRLEQQEKLAKILQNPFDEQIYLSLFLTKSGGGRARSSFLPTNCFEMFPDLENRMIREQERLITLLDKRKALISIENTMALITLGHQVTEHYRAMKTTRGFLDYDDLIEKTAALLEDPAAAAWVHYKLDQGLDHILVDEAQDTSPRQWAIIESLANEFFAGLGARNLRRTIFAVGDEKQSIYSFQGASPDKFALMRDHFSKRAEDAGERLESVPLALSFRSTSDVLAAVDQVFAGETMQQSVSREYEPHMAARQRQPGFVELWPAFQPSAKREHEGEWWEPLDRAGDTSPIVQLAERVATTIADLLGNYTRLEGTGNVIQPGDILVLSRKRGPIVDEINRALKANGVPVAGSDRLKLSDNIGVHDLVALARFCLLSEDDLALAGVLKSPLIGLSEDALFELAHGRPDTLWNALYRRAALKDVPFVEAYETLARWRTIADRFPPYDFFMNVLSKDGARARLLSALGPETEEVLEAFLHQVISYEASEPPTLQGFLHAFGDGSITIRRDMDASGGAVRVMTTHGAKGLEAPVVFLVSHGRVVNPSQRPDFLDLSTNTADGPFIWRQTTDNRTRLQAECEKREDEATIAEHRRLLYVAMTRAADQLYVAGTTDQRGNLDPNSWYKTIREALEGDAEGIRDDGGTLVGWRWQVSGDPPVEHEKGEVTQQQKANALPRWLSRQASPPPAPAIMLTPSTLGGYDDEQEDRSGNAEDSDPLAGLDPKRRGVLLHKLLEHLPTIDQDRQSTLGTAYLTGVLSDEEIPFLSAILDEALRVLRAPALAPYFENVPARSEIMLRGSLELGERTVKVSGQVDRLLLLPDYLHIIDFKTNRFVPETMDQVPAQYSRQLALYREMLRPVSKGRSIRASLLWTRSCEITEIDDKRLKEAFRSIEVPDLSP